MLLIPANGSEQHHNLWSVFEDNKVYYCLLPISFNKKCCGCSYDCWVFAEKDLAITLINPFPGKTIQLPSVMKIPRFDPPYDKKNEENSIDEKSLTMIWMRRIRV